MPSGHSPLLFLCMSAAIPWALLFLWEEGAGRTEIAGHCLLPDPREGTGVRPGLE